MANALGGQGSVPGWLRSLSPFDRAYGADPLRNGLESGGLALLVGAALLSWLVASWGLARRDAGAR